MIPPLLEDKVFAQQVTDLQEKILRFGEESEITGPYLVAVADGVFAAEAEESFERAAEIPYAPSTLERKARAARDPKGGRRARASTSMLGIGIPSGLNLFSALTFPWDQAVSTPVGLRELQTQGFLFGTKGRLLGRYASLHRTGTKHMPARLDWFASGESLAAAEEKLKDVNAEHWYRAARRAGFTHAEVAEWFDSDPDLAGRY